MLLLPVTEMTGLQQVDGLGPVQTLPFDVTHPVTILESRVLAPLSSWRQSARSRQVKWTTL